MVQSAYIQASFQLTAAVVFDKPIFAKIITSKNRGLLGTMNDRPKIKIAKSRKARY